MNRQMARIGLALVLAVPVLATVGSSGNASADPGQCWRHGSATAYLYNTYMPVWNICSSQSYGIRLIDPAGRSLPGPCRMLYGFNNSNDPVTFFISGVIAFPIPQPC
jgi:hypothetical protein